MSDLRGYTRFAEQGDPERGDGDPQRVSGAHGGGRHRPRGHHQRVHRRRHLRGLRRPGPAPRPRRAGGRHRARDAGGARRDQRGACPAGAARLRDGHRPPHGRGRGRATSAPSSGPSTRSWAAPSTWRAASRAPRSAARSSSLRATLAELGRLARVGPSVDAQVKGLAEPLTLYELAGLGRALRADPARWRAPEAEHQASGRAPARVLDDRREGGSPGGPGRARRPARAAGAARRARPASRSADERQAPRSGTRRPSTGPPRRSTPRCSAATPTGLVRMRLTALGAADEQAIATLLGQPGDFTPLVTPRRAGSHSASRLAPVPSAARHSRTEP